LEFTSISNGIKGEFFPPFGSHSDIIDTMRATYFGSTKAVGYRYIDKFSSSIPAKENEKELPVALLALVMTAVNCSIHFAMNID